MGRAAGLKLVITYSSLVFCMVLALGFVGIYNNGDLTRDTFLPESLVGEILPIALFFVVYGLCIFLGNWILLSLKVTTVLNHVTLGLLGGVVSFGVIWLIVSAVF